MDLRLNRDRHLVQVGVDPLHQVLEGVDGPRGESGAHLLVGQFHAHHHVVGQLELVRQEHLVIRDALEGLGRVGAPVVRIEDPVQPLAHAARAFAVRQRCSAHDRHIDNRVLAGQIDVRLVHLADHANLLSRRDRSRPRGGSLHYVMAGGMRRLEQQRGIAEVRRRLSQC